MLNIPLLLYVLIPSVLVLAVLGWHTWVWWRSRSKVKPQAPARDWGRLSMGPPMNQIPRHRQGRIPGKPIGPFGIDYNGAPLAMRGNLKTRDEIINDRTAAAHKEATTSDGTPLAPIRETPMEVGTRVHKEIEQGFARIGRLEVIEAIEKLTPEQVDKLVEAGALNRNQVAAVRAEYAQRAKYNLSALTDKVLGKDYRAAYADLDSAPETLTPQTTYTDTENTLELERAIGFPRTLTQHEIAERQAGYTGLRNSPLRDAVKPASFVLQPEQRVPLEVTPEKAAEIKKLWLDSWPETKAYFEHMQQLSVSGEIDTEARTRSKVEVSRERIRRVLKAAHENAPSYGGPRVMIGVDPGVPSSGVFIVDHDGNLVDPSTVSVKHGDITREMIERATPEQLLAGSSLSNMFSTGKRLDKNPGSAHITIENLAETAKEMRAKGEELRATDRKIARMRYRLKMLKLDQRFGGRGKWPEVVQFDREELWRETRDPHAHHGIMMPVFRQISEGVHQHPVWTGSLSDGRTTEYAMRYPSKMLRLEAPRHTSSWAQMVGRLDRTTKPDGKPRTRWQRFVRAITFVERRKRARLGWMYGAKTWDARVWRWWQSRRALVTGVGHGIGDVVKFSSSGPLPPGLDANASYVVTSVEPGLGVRVKRQGLIGRLWYRLRSWRARREIALLRELAEYPTDKSRSDDMVDALAYGMNWIPRTPKRSWFRRLLARISKGFRK